MALLLVATLRPGHANPDEGIALPSASETPLAESISPPLKILFMRVAFQDEPQEPITDSGARLMMTQVHDWFADASYGQVSIEFDITPLLILPETKNWYSERALTQLLVDARAQALTAGFDSSGYNYDIARHTPVPGWNFSGLGLAGQKGLWLQLTHLGVLIHELGHNLGLQHANLWAAVSDSIIGPGTNVDYGNISDTMATPEADPRCCDFNAFWKFQLGWLTGMDVNTASTSRRVRLHALDAPGKVPGQTYAIRIPKDDQRAYWLEFRQKFPGNPWSQQGIWINWPPWPESHSGTQLLDTTPGTPSGNNSVDDAPLTVGRTLADPLDGVYITPLAVGTAQSNRWIDVQINLGAFPSNRIPSLTLVTGTIRAGLDESVKITANGSDPDGDSLAYSWDFGDSTFGLNSNVVTKAWSSPGNYVVRCTTSDMKGGTCSRFVLIEVGSTTLLTVAGRVVDTKDQPVSGVRIHNGASGLLYRGTETDCEGRYVLSNLSPGDLVLAAVKYGFKISPIAWINPLAISTHVTNADWRAIANPLVRVTVPDSAAAEPAGTNNFGVFTIERAEPLTTSLTVTFRMSGSATFTQDYQLRGLPANPTVSVVLPAGLATTNIVVRPAVDELTEKPESVILTLLEQDEYRLDANRSATVWISDFPVDNNLNPVAAEDVLTRFTFGIAQISVSTLLSNDSDPDGDAVLFVGVQATSTLRSDVFAFDGVVYYIPKNDSPGEDSFVYTITDARGGTANGLVRVISLTPPPPLLNIAATETVRQLSGSNGAPWQIYRLEFTDTLAPPAWSTLTAVTNDSFGRFSISDPTPALPPSRFYRTVSP